MHRPAIIKALVLLSADWLTPGSGENGCRATLDRKRFPDTDTVRNLFKRFAQQVSKLFWRPPWHLADSASLDAAQDGWRLNRDTTVLQRSGKARPARLER